MPWAVEWEAWMVADSEPARLKKGDPEAFDALLNRYQNRLFRYLLRLTGNAAHAEDLSSRRGSTSSPASIATTRRAEASGRELVGTGLADRLAVGVEVHQGSEAERLHPGQDLVPVSHDDENRLARVEIRGGCPFQVGG